VLSKGVLERLKTSQETLDFLIGRDVAVHVLQTDEAIAKYNELRKDHAVGGLFHSTC
jgi:hypothetical protein